MPPKRSKRSTSKNAPSLDIQPLVSIPQLDFFTRQQIQVQIQEVVQQSILPIGALTENAPINFTIRGDPAHFIDPKSVRLKLTVEVRNADGSQIAGDSNCAPIANLAGSLFSTVVVTLGNSTKVTSSSTNYPYVMYMENVIRSSSAYKNQYDFVSLIYRDASGSFDVAGDRNPGYQTRRTQCAGSEPIRMIVHIESPITSQDRYLLPMVDLSFQLIQAPAKFLIRSDILPMAQRNQKILISNSYIKFLKILENKFWDFLASISMIYNKVRLNTEFQIMLMKSIQTSMALYPVTFKQTFEFSRQPGVTSIRETIFYDRLLPHTVYLFMVSTNRRQGTYDTTPWLINYSQISEIKLVSGADSFPSIPYRPLLRDVNEMYISTKECLGCMEPGMDNGLDISDFMGGYGLISFRLSRSGGNLDGVPRMGDLQLHVDFHEGLLEATTFLLVMEFYRNIYVRNNLDIVTEFIP